MSTTTDRLQPACSATRGPKTLEGAGIGSMLRQVCLALGAWALLAVGLTPVLPMSDTVIAFGAPERLLRALPQGQLQTLGAGVWSVSLAVDSPAQVRALYSSGAWLVLPASRSMCVTVRGDGPLRAPRPVM